MSCKLTSGWVLAVLSVSVIVIGFGQVGRATDPCSAPQVRTDQPDYAPGSTVFITGCGFLGGETVQLQVSHTDITGDNDTSPAHDPWAVTGDASGSFQSTWLVPVGEDELGATLQLAALGETSGWLAQTLFTDSPTKLGAVAMLHQNPRPVTAGDTAAYDLTITRGTDRNSGGNLTVAISVTGLPVGATYVGTTNLNLRPKQGVKRVMGQIATTAGLPDGTYTFTVNATSHNTVTTIGTLIVGTGVFTGPTAVDDTTNTVADTAVTVNVRANDLPVLPAVLTVISVTDPTNGSVTNNGDGTVTYTPDAGFNGEDTFTYTIQDINGFTDSALVTIFVGNQNHPPVASNDDYAATAGTTLTVDAPGVLGNDTDPDGDSLTAELSADVSHGTLTLNADGSFAYTPATGFTGTDSFTYFADDVRTNANDELQSNEASVTIIVTSVCAAASINLDPSGATACVGDSASFTAAAAGTAPLSYRWRRNSVDLTDAGNIFGSATATLTINPVSGGDAGSYDLVVSNACGGATSQAASLTVDSAPQIITCPDNIATNTDAGECVAHLAFSPAFSGTPTPTVVCDPPSGSAFSVGTTNVNCTASNSCGVATCSFSVTVVDNQPPTISCPLMKTVNADPSQCSATHVDLGSPVTGDNCGVASVTSNAPASFSVGTNCVAWTVTDVHGNSATCTQKVIVVDNQPPTISCPPTKTVNADPSQCSATHVDLGSPVTGDYCGVATVTSNAPSSFHIGTNCVAWTVTDVHGNSAVCTQKVIVVDNQPPSITCPGDISTNAPTSQCSVAVTFAPQVSDNCTGVVFSCTPPSGSLFAKGATAVNCTATDAAGLTASCSFTVTVRAAVIVTATPALQTNQYSDAIAPVTIAANDCGAITTLTASTSWKKAGDPSFATTRPLGGLTLMQTNATTWTLTGKSLVPAGTYVVRVTVTDGSDPGYADVTIVVRQEDATITYTGDTMRTTSATNSTSTVTVNLAAMIQEAADGSLGDKLNTTQLQFTVFKSSDATFSTPVASCTGAVAATGPGTGAASCTANLPADGYVVKVALLPNGYYTAPIENAVLTIDPPGTGVSAGGGWLLDPASGLRDNFGFTVKFLKNGNLQGNCLYIARVRRDIGNGVRDYNWIYKSNSMTGLHQSCTTNTPTVCTAVFTGKLTITAVDRLTGAASSLGGNYKFEVDVTDNGEPGSGALPDTYAVRVWTSSGTYYQLGTPNNQLPLNGGNIQVRP